MTHFFSASNDQAILSDIRRAISKGKCILAVGSELSIQAYTEEGEHPPLWKGLLEKMARWCLDKGLIDQETTEEVLLLIREEFLDDAGQELEEILTRNRLLPQCIRETLLCDRVKVSEIHHLITEIPFRAYLTTNYDTFIETAYLLVKGKPLIKFYETSIQGALTEYRDREDHPFILKLHGDIDNSDSIILSDRAFERFLHRSSNYWRELEKLLAISSILFIGFGMADHDLTGMLNKIDIFDRSNKHWMIIPETPIPPLKAKHLKEDKGVRVIQYKDNETHTELIKLLKDLAAPLSPMRLPSDQGVRLDRFEVINKLSQGTSKIALRESMLSNTSLTSPSTSTIKVFYTYSPSQEDDDLRKSLEKGLDILKWKGLIANWYARSTEEDEKGSESRDFLNSAQVILLLVSTDFVASDYCYSNEIMVAVERHKAGTAHVIPIILRAVDYEGTSFDEFSTLPTNKIPITSWSNRDEAFHDVYMGIRKVVEELNTTFNSGISSSLKAISKEDSFITVEQDSLKVMEFLPSLREQIIDHPEFSRVYEEAGRIGQEVLHLTSALTLNYQRLREMRANVKLYPGRRQYQEDIDAYLQGLSNTNLEIERVWRQIRSAMLTKTESIITQIEEQASTEVERQIFGQTEEKIPEKLEQLLLKKNLLNSTLEGLKKFKDFLVIADDIKKAAINWPPDLAGILRNALDNLNI